MPYCPKCGKQVSQTQKFCKECGCNLITEEVQQGQPIETATVQKCAVHPTRNAIGVCDSCGNAVCDLCRTISGNRLYCAICFNKILRHPSMPTVPASLETHESDTSQQEDVEEINIGVISESLIARKKRNRAKIITALIILAIGGVFVWLFIPCSLSIVINPTDGGVVTGDITSRPFSHTQITAIPNGCYRFNGWTGEGINNSNSSSAAVNMGMSGRTITANFKLFCIAPCEGHQYWEYLDTQPPYYANAFSDAPINLENSVNAVNPTWSQLKAFVQADHTDQKTYIAPLFMCGDFAEQVHNNAEQSGIKAAFVAIEFNGSSAGHALNAFNTTDRGLVYIDCTGGQELLWGHSTAGDWDKIAYVIIGKEYGLISLDKASGVTYDVYEQYRLEYQVYVNAVNAYNSLYESYTGDFIDQWGCELDGDAAACSRLNSMYNELVRLADELDRLSQEWDDVWKPLGIVENISVYW